VIFPRKDKNKNRKIPEEKKGELYYEKI